MKKILLTLSAALVLLNAAPQTWATAKAQPCTAHKKVYGYFNYNGMLPANTYGFSTFYMDDMTQSTVVYQYSDAKSIYAGAAVDDVFYAYEYKFDPYMGPKNGSFISYDLTTGRYTELGTGGLDAISEKFKPQDMTYDYSTGTMYAVGFNQGESALYTVSLADGTLNKVTTLKKTIGVVAASHDGKLYGVGGNDGTIYEINKSDGSVKSILETEFGGLDRNQTMEFDHSTGLLYWVACSYNYDKGAQAHMLCIDLKPEASTITNLGEVGFNSTFQALYIPFAPGGDEAPAAPGNFTVTPGANGTRAAILSWAPPTATFAGSILNDAVTGYAIERNGVKIATVGADATTFEDLNIDNDGYYSYTMYALNGHGSGGKARAKAFIGSDKPGEVSNITFTVGKGCESATLSWEAPTKGFNNGYFSPVSVRYKVIRKPDNKTVAENLAQTTFTDANISRLGRYSYTVYAYNEHGETPVNTMEAYVLGKAMSIPMVQDFSNVRYFENQWMTFDGNNDNYSWLYTSEWGLYQFGDTEPCMEYIINPGIDNNSNNADEWLITPPLTFEATKSYKMSIRLRCISDETIEFTTGANNVYTTHEKFDNVTFNAVADKDNDKWLYADYDINLPAGLDGTRCIGVHLVSPYPGINNVSYLQIGNISIDETTVSQITNVECNDADGSGDVYSLDGRLVRTDGQLKGLTSGIYIKGGKKYVVK